MGKYFGRLAQAQDEDVWTAESEIKKCRFHTSERPELRIGALLVRKVQALCLIHKETEFLVYLYGDCLCGHVMSEHGIGDKPCESCGDSCKQYNPNPEFKAKRVITDLYIPQQIVSAGSVHMESDENIPVGCLGALHKHPGDGRTRFSCIDDDNLNVNHDISIVISSSGALEYWYATVRQQHPCGCLIHGEARTLFLIVTEDVMEGSKRITRAVQENHGNFFRGGGFGSGGMFCRFDNCYKKFNSTSSRESHEKDKHGSVWSRDYEDSLKEEATIKESYSTRE